MTLLSTLEIGAAYIRVSSDEQTELSPDAQVRVIKDAAKADGYYIPDEFIFMEERGIYGNFPDLPATRKKVHSIREFYVKSVA